MVVRPGRGCGSMSREDHAEITSRLDYLQDLGIDAIWITPMYPSPGIDYGYGNQSINAPPFSLD